MQPTCSTFLVESVGPWLIILQQSRNTDSTQYPLYAASALAANSFTRYVRRGMGSEGEHSRADEVVIRSSIPM